MNPDPPESPIYGLLAEFAGPDELLAAAEKVRDAGYLKTDAFSPFPLHGLSEALGIRKSRVAMLILIGGICGGLGGFFMLAYSATISYPFNIGGRPTYSWPAFIPITFEMTILGAALSAVFGMLGLNGFPQPYHPLFNVKSFADYASSDRFFIAIESSDAKFNLEETRRFLQSLPAREVTEVPR